LSFPVAFDQGLLFAKAWSKANIKLQQTCLCLPAMPGM